MGGPRHYRITDSLLIDSLVACHLRTTHSVESLSAIILMNENRNENHKPVTQLKTHTFKLSVIKVSSHFVMKILYVNLHVS